MPAGLNEKRPARAFLDIIAVMIAERELIERSRGGDTAAFSRLIRRYEGRIFSLAKNVCAGLPAEADDVYQETFLTAFKKIRGFRGEAELGTWLYRIASNLCFMRHRKKKREPFVPLLDRPHDHENGKAHQFRDWAPTPEEIAGKKELIDQVAKALAALPVEYRLILTLRDIEGLSNEKTAEILKLSLAAVKSRLHRGRLFLRDEFERSFGAKESFGKKRHLKKMRAETRR
jgi:RNA polymerase sigma-70 factor (ECF subfamily)